MSKKENKNTENIAAGLSTAAGSLLGTTGAKATVGQIKSEDTSSDDDVVVQHMENSDDVVVVSHSNGDAHENVIEQIDPEPIPEPDPTPDPIVIYPEPNFIIEDVYAGPEPEPMYAGPDPEPVDPDIDPVVCVYGPPEPDPFPDLDNPDADYLADS